VAQACNLNYSGGRDQDCGLKPAWANSLRPYLEKAHHKKGLMEQLKVEALRASRSTTKKKKKKKKNKA
jgi:hypothetical protein